MKTSENIPDPLVTHIALAIYKVLTMTARVWAWIATAFPGYTDFYLAVFDVITKGSLARWCLGKFQMTP